MLTLVTLMMMTKKIVLSSEIWVMHAICETGPDQFVLCLFGMMSSSLHLVSLSTKENAHESHSFNFYICVYLVLFVLFMLWLCLLTLAYVQHCTSSVFKYPFCHFICLIVEHFSQQYCHHRFLVLLRLRTKTKKSEEFCFHHS